MHQRRGTTSDDDISHINQKDHNSCSRKTNKHLWVRVRASKPKMLKISADFMEPGSWWLLKVNKAFVSLQT